MNDEGNTWPTRWRTLSLAIVAAILVRFVIAPFFYGFQYDVDIYGSWAKTLTTYSLRDFYAHAEAADHLPGDLYIHWILAHLFQLFGGESYAGPTYRFLLKAFPSIVDGVLIYVSYLFLRSRSTARIAIDHSWLLALSPALIFLSAAWGQWDNLSMTLFLLGLLLLWSKQPRPIVAAILFSWALLIKPPLMLLVVIAVAGYAWKHWNMHRSIAQVTRDLALIAVTAVVTVTALMAPFGMTWLDSWDDVSLQGRLTMAAELYPFTTLGAANIWMIPLGKPARISDTEAYWGVSPQTLGMALMFIAISWIVYRTVRSRMAPEMFIWAMAMVNFSYFMLPTRSHERYLFPAIILLMVLAALTQWRDRITNIALAVSLVYFLNLVFVYATPSGLIGIIIFETLSIANCLAFGYLLFIPIKEITSRHPSQPAATQTTPESHPAG